MNVPPITPLRDEDFYRPITNGNVSVENIEGKGKAMVAKQDFNEGDIILTDHALVVTQDLEDRIAGIPICAHTMKSLETPIETFERVTDEKVPKMQHMHTFIDDDGHDPVDCVKGCPLQFRSEKIRKRADKQWHRKLCKGRMTEEQREAYTAFENTKWKQGGIDYSDSFHVLLHAVAKIMCRNEKLSLVEAWYPFDILAWAMWDELAVEWATRKEAKHTSADVLKKLCNAIYQIFGKESCDAIDLTKERVSRLAGAILLNAQERSPESPFGRYLVWLEEKGHVNQLLGGIYDWRASEPTDVSNELYYSAKAQGIYSTHAVTNHSCAPNAEVQYTEGMDEGLHMVAVRNISKGDEVTISYILLPDDMGLAERQAYLLNHYRFSCTCERCEREKN
eukprot:TRINITY_DN17953_c0_g1_i1.p1 TRINITY_DN17953_c0_g1~~TRINITY_DN17953_c0_g1_i1.p1  ORF type:complete len:393 (+),score=62.96 TRINITY_DN17953_c0_g1_i1:37-1215(+)